MPLTRTGATALAALAVLWPAAAAAQFVDRTIATGDTPPDRDGTAVGGGDSPRVTTDGRGDDVAPWSVRLTLSSFVFRELGGEAAPLVVGGDAPTDASPVRRFFGDARLQLDGRAAHLDARVRQTTGERYQAGAASGAEYELRTASAAHRLGATELRLGRQLIGEVGATRIDGLAVQYRATATWTATAFGGAYPARGSRSISDDYPDIRGGSGAPLVPIAGGVGASYRRPSLHGDLGIGAIEALQEVPGASGDDGRRVFASAGGYWRPARWLDAYHYGMVDVAGGGGARLTNGSLGVDAYPTPWLELALAAHHVDTELLEIGARNLLEDPDPAAMGVVQNDAAIVRVSQDQARAAASVAVDDARFEVSAAAGLHHRPAIDVPLTGGGVVSFPEASMTEASLTLSDRRAPGGLRLSLSGSRFAPFGDQAPSRSRGELVRLAATHRGERFDVEADVMAQRFEDLGPRTGCTALDPLVCHGTARSRAVQAGALVSLRAGAEWQLLLDGHAGARDAESSTLGLSTDWPRVFSVTAFARLVWRYR